MQGRVWTSTYHTLFIDPFDAKDFLFVALDVLERKVASCVPNLYGSVIWAWSENVWSFAESDAADPLGMRLESLGRSRWLSSIPKSNLSIFMCRQNLLTTNIQRNDNRISCKDSISSFKFCDISDSNLVTARCWNHLLIIHPRETLDCSVMDSLGC